MLVKSILAELSPIKSESTSLALIDPIANINNKNIFHFNKKFLKSKSYLKYK